MSKKQYICVYDNNTSEPEDTVGLAFEWMKDQCDPRFDECFFYEVSEVKVEQKTTIVETAVLNSKAKS